MATDATTTLLRTRYSTGAIVLHWLTALMIAGLIVLGWRMDDTRGADQFAIFQLHKSLGISVLLLTLVRIGWRIFRRPPAPLAGTLWEIRLAKLVHFFFYAALIALPLSGWLAVSTSEIRVPTVLFQSLPWPDFPGSAGLDRAARHATNETSESVHVALTWLLYALIFLHVAGAMKHHLLEASPTFARMLPGTVPKRLFDWRLVATLVAILAVMAAGFAWRASTSAPAPPQQASAPAAPPPGIPAAELEPAVVENTAAAVEEPTEIPKWSKESGSTLGFKTSWGGQAIQGSFADWSADIRFHPDALDRSSVRVTVDIGSARTGRIDVDGALPGEAWFDSAQFPRATFTAKRFEHVAGNRYRASGMLTMKGVSKPLSFPFTLRIDGDNATMNAQIALDRLRFNVGTGEYADTTSIPANVSLDVNLKAKKQP